MNTDDNFLHNSGPGTTSLIYPAVQKNITFLILTPTSGLSLGLSLLLLAIYT